MLDLTGQQFGRLTVLREGQGQEFLIGGRRRTWHCKCICGQEVTVLQDSSRSGHTRSCGCFRSATQMDRH